MHEARQIYCYVLHIATLLSNRPIQFYMTIVYTTCTNTRAHTETHTHTVYSYIQSILNMENADPPRANLVLGRRFTAEEIREGSNVYLECQTRSNPPIQRLTWMHNVSNALFLLFSFSFLLLLFLSLDGVDAHMFMV